MQRVTFGIFVTLVSLLIIASFASAQNTKNIPVQRKNTNIKIAPTINTKKRNAELVFLEHADELLRYEGDDYLILTGNVEFSKGGMRMFTDSAHYYDKIGSFDAFGNVRMEQGDTLFIYADELNYDGPTEMANLFGYNGKPVRLINRQVKLETDIFTYDMFQDLCYYTTGGVLTDRDNRLQSVRGEYNPTTKEANFYEQVILTSHRPDDELKMVNKALYYNTMTHIAEFHVPTVITNKDGRIDSDDGIYNTETRLAQLFSHSLVTTTRGSTLEGDTLFYDRITGIGEAWGNMALIDSVKQSTLKGNYGYYNEIIDSAFVTGRAVAMEYSQGDTLFIHGRYISSVLNVDTLTRVIAVDTIYVDNKTVVDTLINNESFGDSTFNSVIVEDAIENDSLPKPSFENFTLVERTEQYVDSTHTISAWPRVRIYRSDVQGICDSLVFTQADSIVRMFHHPIVWSEDRQIFGDVIEMHVNDSTVESATLPEFGFMAQQIEDKFFNQLTGKYMKAWFKDGKMYRSLVEGNVEGIIYPQEEDSTYNKLVYFKTSNLEAFFENQKIQKMKMWAETSGEAIPLYLAKYSDLHLGQFNWYTGIRPLNSSDIFIIPPEMEQLMSDHKVEYLPNDGIRREDFEDEVEEETADSKENE